MGRTRKQTLERRALAERIVEHATALSTKVVAATFPIYQATERGKPDAYGSAVLLALGDTRFVLTATHVLARERVRELGIATGTSLSPLRGDRVRVYREATTLAGDDIDVTAVRVEGDEWRTVPTDAFAGWDDLDHSPSRHTRDSFALLGYPITKQKGSVSGDRIEAFAYRALGKEATLPAYEAERRDPQSSIMMGLQKNQMWSAEGLSTAPDMYGMSGSGVWRFGPNILAVSTKPRLSGIVVEWREKGRHPHLLGTRIVPIIAALTSSYSDVRRFVEQRTYE